MKNKPARKITRRNQARSVPGPPVVYRFLRRSETLFVATGEIALIQAASGLETDLARGDSAAPGDLAEIRSGREFLSPTPVDGEQTSP
jgi:hypothetical protein